MTGPLRSLARCCRFRCSGRLLAGRSAGFLDAAVAGMAGERRDGQRALTTQSPRRWARDSISLPRLRPDRGRASPTSRRRSLRARVVVATSTIALQSQLVSNDLPALQQHSAVPFTYALLKGRSNYLCLAKLRAAAQPDALFESRSARDSTTTSPGSGRSTTASETGDRCEVDDDDRPRHRGPRSAAPASSVRARPSAPTATSASPSRRANAPMDAQILVVNHALYCVHLAAGGSVLPEHDVVVVDEAHAFADNATNAFAAELATDAAPALAGMLARAGVDNAAVDPFTESVKRLADDHEREGPIDVRRRGSSARRLGGIGASRNGRDAKLVERATRREADRAARAGRLDVLRRLAAPGDDDVVWVETVGRNRRSASRRSRPARRARRTPARPSPGHRGVGDARRRTAVRCRRPARAAPNVPPGCGANATTTGGSRSKTGRGYVRCTRRRRSTGAAGHPLRGQGPPRSRPRP